jgi:hypothetical protein
VVRSGAGRILAGDEAGITGIAEIVAGSEGRLFFTDPFGREGGAIRILDPATRKVTTWSGDASGEAGFARPARRRRAVPSSDRARDLRRHTVYVADPQNHAIRVLRR